jgi:hypothetical protein
VNVLAGIAWDPQIRGILAVAIGVIVLCGSVYLLVGSNTGPRLGLLISLAGLFGWMFLMGIIWWMYGIGMKGDAPTWQVKEVNYGAIQDAATGDVRTITTKDLPPPKKLSSMTEPQLKKVEDLVHRETGGWEFLPESNPLRGEAQAAVDAALTSGKTQAFESNSDYLPLYGFVQGGKKGVPENANWYERAWHRVFTVFEVKNPTHYAVLQVQEIKHLPANADGSPAPKVVDPTKPVITVVMERKIGDLRFPSAVFTFSNFIIFAICVWMLHQRDKLAVRHRTAVAPAGG